MKIGLLCSIIRKEEKLLLEELRNRGLDFQILDDRELVLRLNERQLDFDVVLERCVNHSRALSKATTPRLRRGSRHDPARSLPCCRPS